MKTGTGRLCRHPVVLAAIFAGTLVLPLLLSGCDDHSPVAAPTSTLPAKDSSTDPSGDQSTPSVPEYKTDLDLSAEDKKAVEGALVAFDGFLMSINSAYSGNFDAISDFHKYARGDALGSINDEAESIKKQHATFDGKIDPISVSIYDIGSPEKEQSPAKIVVHFCVDTTRWSLTQKGQTPSENPDGLVTMEHTLLREDEVWKVDTQSLWERKC